VVKTATKRNTDLLSLTSDLQAENEDYTKGMAELVAQYGEGSQEVQDFAAQHSAAMNRIAYDLYVAKLQTDGFTDAEFQMALAAGEAFGVVDKSTAQIARAFEAVTEALTTGKTDTVEFAAQLALLPAEVQTRIKILIEGQDQLAILMNAYYTLNPGAYVNPNLVGSGQRYASGGSFVVPSQYGYEGFSMGGMATASAGETVTITPKGRTNTNGGMMGFDYDRLISGISIALRDVMQGAR
jgi:hypothetical protein